MFNRCKKPLIDRYDRRLVLIGVAAAVIYLATLGVLMLLATAVLVEQIRIGSGG
jgi:hypothetical protein